MMRKYLIIIPLLLVAYTSRAQLKKNSAAVSEVKTETIASNKAVKKCFYYTSNIAKEGRMYVTTQSLEYGTHSRIAQMLVTTYDYDIQEAIEAKSSGLILSKTETTQIIDGTYKIVSNKLTFIPEDKGKLELRTFQLIFHTKVEENSLPT